MLLETRLSPAQCNELVLSFCLDLVIYLIHRFLSFPWVISPRVALLVSFSFFLFPLVKNIDYWGSSYPTSRLPQTWRCWQDLY
uniref:Uncharacterized protein n=1 Tax=Gasterosteus aculeatus TaxID=69293 RepID=G3PQE0_GASAC